MTGDLAAIKAWGRARAEVLVSWAELSTAVTSEMALHLPFVMETGTVTEEQYLAVREKLAARAAQFLLDLDDEARAFEATRAPRLSVVGDQG